MAQEEAQSFASGWASMTTKTPVAGRDLRHTPKPAQRNACARTVVPQKDIHVGGYPWMGWGI